MYPFLRLAYQLLVTRNAPPIAPTDTHVSHHRCWPWDLDMFLELNNGRTLTIYDLGRVPGARRAGLLRVLREKGWGMTMAGASVRYRSRVRVFEKVEMHSRLVGWDDRFFYLEQSMWRGQTCCNQIVYRAAVTDKGGIVPADRLMEALGHEGPRPKMPQWVRAWIAADNLRPWPPVREDETEAEAPRRLAG
ncbi:acyl-CoA thioesterase [Alterinioella nitratireducens]|jgi:acyl-CoA thioesterase FadM|uniref:acyl-CoA thioesterase n=1 Tax=Alterinioella nitratireducens TaxID=2735915 RepID=UPI0015526663|nr:acyl-CoA thioesterase [Alterinioella nitratireducens]NPD18762.1 acyl-CoA thioesterase [Alterinioella nitratireducens]